MERTCGGYGGHWGYRSIVEFIDFMAAGEEMWADYTAMGSHNAPLSLGAEDVAAMRVLEVIKAREDAKLFAMMAAGGEAQ